MLNTITKRKKRSALTNISHVLEVPLYSEKFIINNGRKGKSISNLVHRLTIDDLLKKTYTIPPASNIKFRTVQICEDGLLEDCLNLKNNNQCPNLHYIKLYGHSTDHFGGDCSYLDTCRNIHMCKYIHYYLAIFKPELAKNPNFKHRLIRLNNFEVLERDDNSISTIGNEGLESWFSEGVLSCLDIVPVPPQWINCNLKTIDLSIFKERISVVMADPPWDIRMELPYSTMTDEEMKNLRIQNIHNDGMIFLWVTGRAMEVARDCMIYWGYKQIDELVWIKTNHLYRLIRTGRTGHWLNHSKEHCLIGIKGNPQINKLIDCDTILAEVRETSRKPDEIYRIIERVIPYGLKLELFGRQHNLRENWITLGNQLNGVCLHDPTIIKNFLQSPGGYTLIIDEQNKMTSKK